MIRRIVHMHFDNELVAQFLELFEHTKMQIRHFPGCRSLELLQDPTDFAHLSTLSTWDDEEALNIYRQSELFISTWAQTKLLFSQKPKALTYFICSNTV